jgi:hypothetical protein
MLILNGDFFFGIVHGLIIYSTARAKPSNLKIDKSKITFVNGFI